MRCLIVGDTGVGYLCPIASSRFLVLTDVLICYYSAGAGARWDIGSMDLKGNF